MKMEGFSLLLLLCAALLCPLPSIAAPQDSDSTTQANKNTEDPMDDFPVKPDMGDNTTAGIAYAGIMMELCMLHSAHSILLIVYKRL